LLGSSRSIICLSFYQKEAFVLVKKEEE